MVAFPVASNAVGTLTDVRRIADLAHEAGALAWADAVHYGPHGPIDVAQFGVDVLICSPYKYFGPHLGVAFARRELSESWRPYKVRPAPNEPLGKRFETGTLPYELLAGFNAAVEYIDSLGWEAIVGWERELGAAVPRRAAASRSGSTACRRWRAACRRSPSRSTGSPPRRPPRGSASAASPSGGATTTRSR